MDALEAYSMSDAELQSRLEEHGFPQMPITDATRRLLIKKVLTESSKSKNSLNPKSRKSLNPKSRKSINIKSNTQSFAPQNNEESQAVLDDPILMEFSAENVQENLTLVSDLDSDVLSALGGVSEEPKFGERIHDNLSRLWLPILRKGIGKEAKDKLMKEYQIPENCTLLQAPKLNPEIAATISGITRNNDKRVESAQQQLGLGITALNKGLSLLLENGTERVKAIKFLSDSSRLLCDLHHDETEVRKEIITPGLDKALLNLIQDVDRDDFLFGQKLSENVKASKIERQGLQMKKPATVKTTAVSVQSSTSRLLPQRYSSGSSNYAASTMMQSMAYQPQQNQNKSRAPAQQR